MKSNSDPALREANDKLLRSVRVAGPKLKLVVEKPTEPGLKGVPRDVATAIGKIADHLDASLRLPRMMQIQVRECGVVNAFYSPTKHAISICHEFWDDTYALFNPESRLARCVHDYKDRVHAWATMLESHARIQNKK